MQFLTSLLGGSASTFLMAALALGIVVVLIVLVMWVLKFIFRGNMPKPSRGTRQQRRLSVVENLPVDGKRQLVIVRRDDVEHVLLIGGSQDLVVESGLPVEPRTAVRQQSRRTRQEQVGSAETNVLIPPNQAPAREPVANATQVRTAAARPPIEGERRTQVRHPGLLRPSSRVEPVQLNPENSPQNRPDSARTGYLEAGGNYREAGGQTSAGDYYQGGYGDQGRTADRS